MRQGFCDKYHCKSCDYTTSNKYDYSKHILTRKHQIVNNFDLFSIKSIEKAQTKIAKKFTCDKCEYFTDNKSLYDRHVNTRKHLQKSQETQENTTHVCNICNKQYNSYNSLWKHSRKCVSTPPIQKNEMEESVGEILNESRVTAAPPPSTDISSNIMMEFLKTSKEMQMFLIEQNKELQNKLMELAKNQTVTTNTNCHNTTNNQQFNLQFFLNEKCKDAINMVEFVKSIKLQLEDLEETARLGYVEGISRIFVRALNDMDLEKRPIHCTDIKRETVYVKNNDNWEKENPDKKTLKKAVCYIANKNIHQIDDWKQQNPNWTNYDSEEGQVLNKIYMATTGGGTDEEDEKYVKKIIKNVLQEVMVEKKDIQASEASL